MTTEQTKQIFFTEVAKAMRVAGVKHAVIVYEVNEHLCNTAVHKSGEEETDNAKFFDQLSDTLDHFFSQD